MPVAIVALVMGSFLLFIKMLLEYNKDKLLAAGSQDSRSNTMLLSELNDMIAAAVQEAVAPLHERLQELEQKALPPASHQADQKTLPEGSPAE
jgi:hypothetical protein